MLFLHGENMKKYEEWMNQHPKVKAWLKNRPQNTRRAFAERLKDFCSSMNLEPEEWRHMDKFEARDLAWKFVQPLIEKQSSMARQAMVALKSWYRNLNGEMLPFDSGRGGKHNIRYIQKKAVYEKIPNKGEVYRIVDMASSLRDKAILLTLFQSGMRVNALIKLRYGHIKDQLDKDIITLKITRDLDIKLRGSNVPFYITFVNGEGATTLRQYCKLRHKDGTADAPLFYTKTGKFVTSEWVRQIVKMCVGRAGFNPKTMWTHSLRKSFRKVVRQAPIDDDDKEQLMGHVIKGSRQAYFDRKDVDLIRKAYQKCNFTREIPESNHVKMKNELDQLRMEKMSLEKRVDGLEQTLQEVLRQLRKAEA